MDSEKNVANPVDSSVFLFAGTSGQICARPSL